MTNPPPSAAQTDAADALRDAVGVVLRGIDDPEMPISIVDLGIVDAVNIADGVVNVRILPTFVGCPALDMLKDEIIAKTSRVAGVTSVTVSFTFNPPWSPDRISQAGRENLARFGVTVPQRGSAQATEFVQLNIAPKSACPYCGSAKTTLTSPFGPTRCRMIYHCDACGNQFEHMKQVMPAADPSSAATR